jgi:hypothetical protein
VKIHLKTSDEPLKSGSDIIAECGTLVPKAAVAFSFDLQYAETASLNRITTCDACYAIKRPNGILYGLASGQEAMTVDE